MQNFGGKNIKSEYEITFGSSYCLLEVQQMLGCLICSPIHSLLIQVVKNENQVNQ